MAYCDLQQNIRFAKGIRAMPLDEFNGWHLAPGERVTFIANGKEHKGYVTQLLMRQAEVSKADGTKFKVAYDAVLSVKPLKPEMTPKQVIAFFESNKKKWNSKEGQQKLRDAGFNPYKISDCSLKIHFGHKTALGWCSYQPLTVHIAVTAIQMLPKRIVKDIVLHEIAHALAGGEHGHDDEWSELAIAIGSTGERVAEANVESIVESRLKGKIKKRFGKSTRMSNYSNRLLWDYARRFR